MVRPEDIEELEKVIDYLIQYPQYAEEVARRARESVERDYSKEPAFRKIMDILASVRLSEN